VKHQLRKRGCKRSKRAAAAAVKMMMNPEQKLFGKLNFYDFHFLIPLYLSLSFGYNMFL
jgi:hypothetical protein